MGSHPLRTFEHPLNAKAIFPRCLLPSEQESADLLEVVGKYGWTSVSRCVREILNYSERMTRLAIRAIPDGEYEAEDFLDDDGVRGSSCSDRGEDAYPG